MGAISYAKPAEPDWPRPWAGDVGPVLAALVISSCKEPPKPDLSSEEQDKGSGEVVFPADASIKDAVLILYKNEETAGEPEKIRVRKMI